MALYTIQFSCGHTDTQQLYGPGKERERKIEYFHRSGFCPACYKVERERLRLDERAKASAADAQAAAEKGFPTLIGTPKQVAWAETLRRERLNSVMFDVGRIVAQARTMARRAVDVSLARQDEVDPLVLAVTDAGRALLAGLIEKSDAKYWIDARGIEIRDVVQPVKDGFAREFGGLQRQLDERDRAAEEGRRADNAARAAAEQAQRDAEHARSVVKAQTFRVGDHPESVIRTGSSLTIRSTDGRTAMGYVEDGDWAVYQIGAHEMSSLHPEMERIAREARHAWEARAR